MDFFNQLEQWEKFDLWSEVFMNLKHETVKMSSSLKSDIGRLKSNLCFNRYRDILPFDHTKVPLDNDSYINANFVKISIDRSNYILTQGPLLSTCFNFWSMIWKYDIPIIVMLCNVIENGQSKCEYYWPKYENIPIIFDHFEINLLFKEIYNSFEINEIEIKHKTLNLVKKCFHIQYIDWPDYGIPDNVQIFVDFIRKVQKIEQNKNIYKLNDEFPPICVHCSAGIGRSGTFILVDTIIKQIEQEKTVNNIDVLSTLLFMRSCRINLINTADQLRFSYLSINYYIKNCFSNNDCIKLLLNDDVLYTSNESEDFDQILPLNYARRDILLAVSSIGSVKDDRNNRKLRETKRLNLTSDSLNQLESNGSFKNEHSEQLSQQITSIEPASSESSNNQIV